MKEIYTLNPHHQETVHLACMYEDNWWYQVLKMYVWLDLRTFQVSDVFVVVVWCTDSWLVLEQLMRMVKLLFEDSWMLVSAHLVHSIELSIVHDVHWSTVVIVFKAFLVGTKTVQLDVVLTMMSQLKRLYEWKNYTHWIHTTRKIFTWHVCMRIIDDIRSWKCKFGLI